MVDWLERVAGQTFSAVEAADTYHRRLDATTRGGLPGARLVEELAPRVAGTGSVFRHADLGEDNIVLDRDRLTVLDREWAQEQGFPLADLVYFAGRALRLLDGAGDDPRERYFVELMQGGAPSSARLFAWIRRLAAALDLPADAGGPLVTLGLVEHAQLGVLARLRADQATGTSHTPSLPEVTLESWMVAPGLGVDWRAWR